MVESTSEVIALKVKQVFAHHMMTEMMVHPDNIDVYAQYCAEAMNWVVTGLVTFPTEEYRNRCVASYPETLWDYVKKKLGWKYKSVDVYLHEYVVYPEISKKLAKYNKAGAIEIVYHKGVANVFDRKE